MLVDVVKVDVGGHGLFLACGAMSVSKQSAFHSMPRGTSGDKSGHARVDVAFRHFSRSVLVDLLAFRQVHQ